MAFFDKKQDVIDIEMTQFGKDLLSRGAFKPVYYCFFDDEIIYDTMYVGLTEHQNDSEDRIRDSQRLREVAQTFSVEGSFKNQTKLIEQGIRDTFLKLKSNQNPLEKESILKFPLGNQSAGTQHTPAFDVKALESKFTNLNVSYLTQSHYDIRIPQLEMSPTYNVYKNIENQIQLEDNFLFDDETHFDFMSKKVEFYDKSYILVEDDSVKIDVQEHNVPYRNENFEIEIYEMENPLDPESLTLISDPSDLLELFDIFIDNSISEHNHRERKSKNFYFN
tara:strand:+ start:2253 stop:3086 length:834 start_codon:yes stop_codon:yes gene_type:complete